MTDLHIIRGAGFKSKRPFRLEIRREPYAIWIRAIHETNIATVSASFPVHHFEQWMLQTMAITSEAVSLFGKRSRGEKPVELRIKREDNHLILTFVDDSGKTTNSTVIDPTDWTTFSIRATKRYGLGA